MKKYFVAALFFAVPASGAVVVRSPVAVQTTSQTTTAPMGSGAMNWQPAPMKDGGYVRCKNAAGCHGLASPYPAIIANYGTVMMYKWNGVTGDNRQIGAFWPNGEYMQPNVGSEGFSDEWEGVA